MCRPCVGHVSAMCWPYVLAPSVGPLCSPPCAGPRCRPSGGPPPCLLHECLLHACLLHVTFISPADAPASVPRVPFPPRGCSSSELELVAPGKLLGVAHAWLGVTDRDRHHRDRRRHGHRSSHRGRWA